MFFIGPLSRSHLPHLADKPEARPSTYIPMVYEKVAAEPIHWEYHVLSVDTREQSLPDAQQLTALGSEGWILVGTLDERASGKSGFVYYYFVRQANAV